MTQQLLLLPPTPSSATENPIYASQRPSLQRTFTNKQAQIREQHAAFWAHPAARDDVSAYRRASASHVYHSPPSASDGRCWLARSTPFTVWRGAEPLGASENALLIGNRASFDAGQYPGGPGAAGMSMVHLLVIPRAGLFNGVSLRSPVESGDVDDVDDVAIIDEMVGLFRAAWARLPVRKAVVEHQYAAIQRRQEEAPDDRAHAEALRHWRELRRLVLVEEKLGFDDFAFGLHLWPDHSVGHLHMHVLAAPFEFRKYSTSVHDAKTKDAFEVRDYLKSLRPQVGGDDHDNANDA
ncbi:hypothetical protein F4775DRAFT_595789 [Biscogniauxia sp. FL1348]|nr:hypothetical protein F4775DRAFT_595789 [Biscogniauxia sp. FL1348]